MNNEYTFSVRETSNLYEVVIKFENPFRVEDPDARFAARARILHFMQMNRIPCAKHTKTKRIDERTFSLKIWK